ncbi:hypothetical protein, partial [Streptomyces zaomyceticus]|uniref:hypothetical protein n=1 Tax=Streptomyces zaomyceticus TaxID=68286 RepID=UPI0034307B5F
DDSFLAGPTGRTTAVWKAVTDRFPEERAKGVPTVFRRPRPVPPVLCRFVPSFADYASPRRATAGAR